MITSLLLCWDQRFNTKDERHRQPTKASLALVYQWDFPLNCIRQSLCYGSFYCSLVHEGYYIWPLLFLHIETVSRRAGSNSILSYLDANLF
jgi:hypothetical protein